MTPPPKLASLRIIVQQLAKVLSSQHQITQLENVDGGPTPDEKQRWAAF
jgi:hypothetical protein